MLNFSWQLTQCWLPDKRILQTQHHCAYHLAMKMPLHSPEMSRRSPQVFPESEHSVLPVAGNCPARQPSLCLQSKRLFGSSCGIHQLYLIPKKLEYQIWIRIPGLPYLFVGRYWRKYLRICCFKLVCHQDLFRNKVSTRKCSNQRKRSKQPICFKSQ